MADGAAERHSPNGDDDPASRHGVLGVAADMGAELSRAEHGKADTRRISAEQTASEASARSRRLGKRVAGGQPSRMAKRAGKQQRRAQHVCNAERDMVAARSGRAWGGCWNSPARGLEVADGRGCPPPALPPRAGGACEWLRPPRPRTAGVSLDPARAFQHSPSSPTRGVGKRMYSALRLRQIGDDLTDFLRGPGPRGAAAHKAQRADRRRRLGHGVTVFRFDQGDHRFHRGRDRPA